MQGQLLIAGAIYLGITMYKGTHTEVLINITVVGGNSQQVEWLEESFAEYAGISPEDGIIKIQANLSADAGDSTSKIALATLIGAEAVDVLVCPKEIYESYSGQDGFMNIEELPEADNLDILRAWQRCPASGIRQYLEERRDVLYDEPAAAIPVTSKNQDMAARFLEYLQQCS